MKRILVVLSLVCFSTLNGQSLNEAEKLFNVFEYQRAYAIYHQLKADKTFSSEDIKRYAYSSYTIGEFETCYSLLPELTAIKDIEPFFTYMKGEVCLNLKKYDEAKQAYSAYQAMDDEYNVTYKIESCDLISTWENQETLELINSTGNNSKADFCGVKTPFGQIEYHEEGVDSSGIEMTTDLVDYSELLLLRPFLKDREGNLHRIVLEEAFKYASVNSMAIHPSTGNVFLSLSEPVSNVLEKTSPHIYKGTWNATEFSISAISPWEFGGFNDTSSCAHVTLSENGELLAFSKMTDEQSDIYLSKFSNNTWNNPTSLEQVNTNLNEMYPLFQGDSLLSFATDGRPGYGNLDIHTYNLSNHKITHLKAPVNSSKDDFNFVYESADSALFVSNRFGGKGDDDRYEIIFRRTKTEPVVVPDSTDYFDFVDNWVDQKIYFDFDKYNLKNDVKIIDKLIALMKKYPAITIQLEAHADKRGEVAYNDVLSLKRAESVRAALVQMGIPQQQILIEAKGEKDPIVDCVKCSDEIYAANRVVIITLKK